MKLPTLKLEPFEKMIGKAEASGVVAAIIGIIYNVAADGDWKTALATLGGVAIVYLSGYVTTSGDA